MENENNKYFRFTTGYRHKSGRPLNIKQGLNLPDLTQSPYSAEYLINGLCLIINCFYFSIWNYKIILAGKWDWLAS
jgi:hypothetical protein